MFVTSSSIVFSCFLYSFCYIIKYYSTTSTVKSAPKYSTSPLDPLCIDIDILSPFCTVIKTGLTLPPKKPTLSSPRMIMTFYYL